MLNDGHPMIEVIKELQTPKPLDTSGSTNTDPKKRRSQQTHQRAGEGQRPVQETASRSDARKRHPHRGG